MSRSIAPTPPAEKRPINFGVLTDQQIAFLEATPWHLEAWSDDDNRLRTVWPQLKMFGRWFSTFQGQPVPWHLIVPSTYK